MKANQTLTGTGLAIVCLCILGVMPVISSSRPAGFGALEFAFFLSVWQVVFATPLFVREMRGPNKGIFAADFSPSERRRVIRATLFTGALFGLSTYLYVYGIEKAGAVSAAIAIQAYPLFAILWEAILVKRRKSMIELALTGLLVGALFYLATGGTGRVDGFSPWILVVLGVPFLWSIAHVIIKEELGRTPITPSQVTFFRVSISTVFLAIVVAVAVPAGFWDTAFRLDFQSVALVMGLVYYLELFVWFHAVRFIDVSLASSITTPWPALTMVLAVVFLGEAVAPYQIGAFAVVVLCIYGLTVAGLRKEKKAA